MAATRWDTPAIARLGDAPEGVTLREDVARRLDEGESARALADLLDVREGALLEATRLLRKVSRRPVGAAAAPRAAAEPEPQPQPQAEPVAEPAAEPVAEGTAPETESPDEFWQFASAYLTASNQVKEYIGFRLGMQHAMQIAR